MEPVPSIPLDEFLEALFPAKSRGFLELRALPSRSQGFFDPGDSRGIRRFLKQHRKENLFFGLATRREQGDGSLANCVEVWALWCDLDFKDLPEAEARRRLAVFALAPSIIIHSGAGLHVYWLLQTCVSVQQNDSLRDVLRRLACAIGGDLSAAEPARILRVPDTLNYKYDPPRDVTIERFKPNRLYDLADFEAVVPVAPQPGPKAPFKAPDIIPLHARNTTLYRLARSLHARGLSQAAILAALREENSAKGRPPLEDAEVQQVAAHAFIQSDRQDFRAKDQSLGGAAESLPKEPTAHLRVTRATTPPWPVLHADALHGLAGEIVRTIDPYTEADPVAVLATLLTGVGNLMGDGPHFKVEATPHPPRLFTVLVGQTAKARKGTAWSTPRHMLGRVDRAWLNTRVTSGLSSGEGVIYAVRDPRIESRPIKEKGRVEGYEDVTTDKGEQDKRLFVVEEEFSQALKVMKREGNILSPTLRQAWDSGNLHPLTKNDPIKATGAHISILGHITRDELLRHLNETEQGNGFANRFIWIVVKRSKVIPNPSGTPATKLQPLVDRLATCIKFARSIKTILRTTEAEELWAEVYPTLSDGKPGLFGAIIARAEVQVMRLACIYALLDRSPVITPVHLRAALALWEYAEASARYIFGTRLGNPEADRIVAALQMRGTLSESEIHDLFNRHKAAAEIQSALELIANLGLATRSEEETGGRPRAIWRISSHESEEK